MDLAKGVVDQLDDLTVTAYRQIAETGGWDDDSLRAVTGAAVEDLDAVLRSLAALRVIEPSPERGRGWTAVSPHVAMARLVSPIEADARRRAAQAARLRHQLQRLVPVHEQLQHSKYGQALEIVGDETALADLLDDELSRSVSSVSVLEPGTHRVPPAGYLDACERGLRYRAVHQHAVRYSGPAAELMEMLTRAGAELGTVDELPLRLFIFDHRSAVLIASDGPASPGGPPPAMAVVVRQPLLVSVLADLFESTWSRAVPFEAVEPQPAYVLDDVKRAILRLLATGAKDELVARRLGISVRTCRRHISDIMDAIGASSRFQTGAIARMSGLV